MPPLLLHAFATFAPGGPQVRTTRLMNALGGAYRHAIVALDGVVTARELLDATLDARVLEAPARAGTFATVRALRALLRRERPDLVLSYNWGAIEAALAARTLSLPLVHHEDGFRPDESTGELKARRNWFRRLVLRGTTLVVPSENLRRIALESWKLAPERVRHVPNGIEIALYAPRDGNAALRARLGIPESAFVVGSVAHLRPEKNVARLLAAAGRAGCRARLWILVVGDGPERAALDDLARGPALAGRVVFAGHQADPRPYYAAMDAFALSSDTEQMPVALVEAMASALPAVATDVGDVRAMLGTEQERCVAPLGPGCEQALAAALDDLAGDPALRARLGAANRARAEREFGFQAMVARYEALYRAALGAGSGR